MKRFTIAAIFALACLGAVAAHAQYSGYPTRPATGVVPLFKSVVSVPSVTSGETDGQVYTMPANTLSADGQSIECWAGFNKAANVNSVTHKLYIFGIAIFNNTTASSAINADVRVRIIRISSSSIRYFQVQEFAQGAPGAGQGQFNSLNFTTTNIVKTTVTGATANGDTNAQFLRCELYP